jgi:hypothetical protein
MRHGFSFTITRWLLTLAAATVVLYAARATLVPTRGLHVVYTTNLQPSGDDDITAIDPVPSTAHISRHWHGAPPQAFSAQWTGFLTTWQSGTYTFALTSDDAGTLSIDGQTLISLPGAHDAQTGTAASLLAPGAHRVVIDYVQYGGDYALDFSWARKGGRLQPVPSWVLTPKRVRLASIVIGRVVDLAAETTLVMTLLLGGWLAWRRMAPGIYRALHRALEQEQQHAPETRPPGTRVPLAAASLLFFAFLAVVHTWPLASDPGHLSRNDNADTMLNTWAVAWVAHELPRDPRHLFDANIFYPEHTTLAYSESMLTQSAIGAPFLWLGASPVFTYNLLVLIGFTLTGWTMCLVIAQWTGSWVAGLVAGCTFGFNTHTLTRIPHLQALHVEFLPLALLALDNVLRTPRIRHALALTGWFVLQALTSVHLFVFTSFALAAATLVRFDILVRARRRRALLLLASSALLAGVLLLPALLPYMRVSADYGFTRSLDVVARYSAHWRDYLTTTARLHYWLWSDRFFPGSTAALFPGALGLLLTLVALAGGIGWTNPRARMFIAMAVVGVALSFGPALPGYALLYQWLPLLQAIRAISRFGYLGIVGVAGLAGFGVVALRRLVPAAAWPFVATGLIAIAALEPLAAPLELTRFDGIPAIYTLPAHEHDAVVVEIPFPDGRRAQAHAEYMLNSTAHWRPILNGYSGFQPNSFYKNADALSNFPDLTSIAALRALRVSHVFVHTDRMSADSVTAVHASGDLHLLARDGAIELYALSQR